MPVMLAGLELCCLADLPLRMVHRLPDRHRQPLVVDVDEEDPLRMLCLLLEVHRFLVCRGLLVRTLEASLESQGLATCSLQLSVELLQVPSSLLWLDLRRRLWQECFLEDSVGQQEHQVCRPLR